ncbi:thiamine biosynthesis lipoprotein ApbE [Lunatimonas lonarensis]|uniref:FAD:protein FMN transferase n=1 Tax=Lunatimonas lonarensis TaxID=1232681 RepID=R7ZW36_9BACT|nr:FAD:protein FMN transferase [Lunatimonas lonarensis]EON78360.1 thiamine biosynthesis lipoprotein ApbE [Lunatimonas lonarensis]
MASKTKNWVILGLAFALSATIAWKMTTQDSGSYFFMEGRALGVFYSLSYLGDAELENSLDSIILVFDQTLNYQRPDAEISLFNRNGFVEFKTPVLYQALLESQRYSDTYQGAVNHFILPLITAWGQDFSNKRLITDERIAELIALCQPENFELTPDYAKAKKEGVMINLSYIDKGYLIDHLSDFLLSRDVRHFQIEFGTDAISYGKGPGNRNHRLVITNPEGTDASKTLIKETKLTNRAYSSSGNFEKFYVDERGFKHSHLLDPRTGRPIENKILSAHIKAPTCTQADALATICMILSLEESQHLITSDPTLEGMIVFNEAGTLQTWRSKGFELAD